jgi:hypothetical protein
MSEEEEKTPPKNHKDVLTQIITAAVGALLVGLQSLNLSETNSQSDLLRRVDLAIVRQSDLVREVNEEGKRIDKALDNQQQMIESMETLLHNQNTTLELLKKSGDTK